MASSERVVISLTTYPARLPLVHITIESLLRQDFKPNRLVLWLSEEEISEQDLGSQLNKQRDRGLEIRFVEGNLRSYKKLYYIASEDTGSAIVTADDDVIYPRYWLRRLMNAYEAEPNYVYCYRSKFIQSNSCGELLPYRDWSYQKGGVEPSYQIFPIGVSGILYPPQSIDMTFLSPEQFMKYCPTADDVWFKVMTLRRRIRCQRIVDRGIHFPLVQGTQQSSLHVVNNLEGHNDEQIRAAFDYGGVYGIIR